MKAVLDAIKQRSGPVQTLYMAPVPVLEARARGAARPTECTMVQWPFLLPHEQIHDDVPDPTNEDNMARFTLGPDDSPHRKKQLQLWANRVYTRRRSSSTVGESQSESQGQAAQAPPSMERKPPSIDQIIPIGLHGDGAAHTKRGTVYGVSWNYLTRRRHATRHLFTVIVSEMLCKCGCGGFHTLDAMFRLFVWSLGCWARGWSPTHAPDGADLGPSYPLPRVALLECRGDWQWFATAFHFRSAQCEHICWKCDAGKGGTACSFAELSLDAAWRSTCMSDGAFRARCRGSENVSALFDAPGFTLDMILVDLLHTLDLGVAQWLIGSVLREFLAEPAFGSNKDERLKTLQVKLDEWRRQTPRSKGTVDKVTEKMIQVSGGPPSFNVKAAETRHFVPFLVSMCSEFGVEGLERRQFDSLHYRRRLICVQTLQNFYDAISASPFQCNLAMREGQRFLRLYGVLHDEARNRIPKEGVERPVVVDHERYPLKPKAHLFDHLVHDVMKTWGSPSDFWTYRDEDFMRTLVSIAERTPNPATIAQRVLEKTALYEALIKGRCG